MENLDYQDPSYVEFYDPISLYTEKFTIFFFGTNSLFQSYYNSPSEVNTWKKMKIQFFPASLSRDLLKQKFHAWCNPKKARTFSNCTKKIKIFTAWFMQTILSHHPKNPEYLKWQYAIKAKFPLYTSRCSNCNSSPTASGSVMWSNRFTD